MLVALSQRPGLSLTSPDSGSLGPIQPDDRARGGSRRTSKAHQALPEFAQKRASPAQIGDRAAEFAHSDSNSIGPSYIGTNIGSPSGPDRPRGHHFGHLPSSAFPTPS